MRIDGTGFPKKQDETEIKDELVDPLIIALTHIIDIARTDLAPDVLNMTEEEWAKHRLARISGLAVRAIKNQKD
jgi:hypothetical protein